ncbi:DUF6262 family protein [Anaerocolumna aminovalerica]|uniref:DUF6262 family protein n=1 Tax=Anaerocolumna aminovalerica TaxID=1527 RepID=UPI000BE41F55|nr:DUF6262 family protein [Anaerocolumna aminovalerica]
MGNKKKLPEGLAKKQELQRQETINKVVRAISDIKAEERKVTITALTEFTGLSRSTFAKPHIWALLVEQGYVQDDNVAVPPKRKKINQSSVILEKDRLITELRVKNTELERECELLRGRLFLVMQNKK